MAIKGCGITAFNRIPDVNESISNIIDQWLEESAGELVARTAFNSRVDTGQTKDSYKYVIDKDEKQAIVGSNLENTIWEEFGTGEYALEGNGRKGGWTYKNPKYGIHGDTREFIHTYGKTPNRPLFRAFNDAENVIINRIRSLLHDLGVEYE